MRYFTSDLHFFDEGIIYYCGRPFNSAEEMNGVLIKNFLEKVNGDGEIYILGDIVGMNSGVEVYGACSDMMRKMGIGNTKTPFHLIRGNHDLFPDQDYLDMGFVSVERVGSIEIAGMTAMLTHDPCMVQPRDTLAICGHIHTLFDEVYNAERNTFTINVGVEHRDYSPVSDCEIIKIIESSKWRSNTKR